MSWQAYNREEPFWWEQIKLSVERMEARLIWMLAQFTSVFANSNRTARETSAFKVQDFIPQWIEDQPKRTDEEEWADMNMHFDAWNSFVEATGA